MAFRARTNTVEHGPSDAQVLGRQREPPEELVEMAVIEQEEEASLLDDPRAVRKQPAFIQLERACIDDDVGGDKGNKVGELGFVPSGTANVMALLNTIMGAGILGLPGAFSQTGYLLGCTLLICFASTSWFGLHLLVCVARSVNPDPDSEPSSFKGVADAAVPSLSALVDAVIFLKCFGVATSYLMLIGDSMPKVAPGTLSRQGWVILGAFVVGPLSYLKSLAGWQLSVANALSLLFAFFTVACITAFAFPGLDPCSGIEPLSSCRGPVEAMPRDGNSVMSVLTVFIFAFTCHQNAFSALHNELPRYPPHRADCVSLTVICSALVTYICISLAGYFTFGKQVLPDVLESFPQNSTVISVMRIAASLLVLMGYPMQAHPARRSICSLLQACGAGGFAVSDQAHWLLTSIFLLTSIGIALAVHNFGLALALVGATGSTSITFILPGLIYFRLFLKPHAKRWLALAQCCLGCVIAPFSLTTILMGHLSNH